MSFEKTILHHIYLKRFLAGAVDLSVELGSAFLGGYFGAMMAALVIVLRDLPAAATQKAMWTGMTFGFIFWGTAASWVNRVLVQGMSRASFGKKMMDLEIISTGAPITWSTMMKHWITASVLGDVTVVSSRDFSRVATVYSIHSQKAVGKVGKSAEDATQISAVSSDKKAA